MTGQWEHKLRLIERGEYDVASFKQELVEMVVDITNSVIHAETQTFQSVTKTENRKEGVSAEHCPKCKKGDVLKGKTAYGCSRHKEGCDFLLPFTFMSKTLTVKQINDLFSKGKTTKIKGFVVPGSESKKDGSLIFTSTFNIELQE